MFTVKTSPYWCENEYLCPGMCISTPNGPACLCNDGYFLKTISDKEKECVKSINYSEITDCGLDYFQCLVNKQCIPKKLLCDGDNDCGDGSDEDYINGPCSNKIFEFLT